MSSHFLCNAIIVKLVITSVPFTIINLPIAFVRIYAKKIIASNTYAAIRTKTLLNISILFTTGKAFLSRQ
jgi:ABC-type molybdate transport system permease subunit